MERLAKVCQHCRDTTPGTGFCPEPPAVTAAGGSHIMGVFRALPFFALVFRAQPFICSLFMVGQIGPYLAFGLEGRAAASA